MKDRDSGLRGALWLVLQFCKLSCKYLVRFFEEFMNLSIYSKKNVRSQQRGAAFLFPWKNRWWFQCLKLETRFGKPKSRSCRTWTRGLMEVSVGSGFEEQEEMAEAWGPEWQVPRKSHPAILDAALPSTIDPTFQQLLFYLSRKDSPEHLW